MKIFKYSLMVLASFSLLLSSCTTEKEEMAEHHFGNKAYINFSENIDEKIVKADTDPDYSRSISFSTALPVEGRVTASFRINPDKMAEFKEGNDPDAQLFPLENAVIEDPEVAIEVGSNLSTASTVKFSKLDQLDKNLVYILPVSLTDVKGVEVLDSRNTVYYLFKGGALINVVVNMEKNRAGAKSWKNPNVLKNMEQFTIEFLVHPNKFGRQISSIMGVEGHFLLRIGDAGVPSNQLQIAWGGNHTNKDMQLEIGEWTHFAIVFDKGNAKVYKNGKLVLDESDSWSPISFLPYGDDPGETTGHRYFWVGYSYDNGRYFDGEMSELRIWNKCLTSEEINAPAHFYTTDPTDPALAAYWKCDEGAGRTLKDSSVNGNDLTLDKDCKWPGVSLPATK